MGGPSRVGWAVRAVGAVGFRYACFAAMTAMAIWNEARPAPRLPDLVLAHTPYLKWVDDWNYVIWLLGWIPWALLLLGKAPRRFCRYMVAGGVVSLLRGICIVATGLGPVKGLDVNAGIAPAEQLHAIFEILDPFGVFGRDAAHIYLTKDLFFSGHTASTFLLLLYVWPVRGLRWPVLGLHVVVVVSVFLSHLHYTIDVLGAYPMAYMVFVFMEGRPAAGLDPGDLGPGWRQIGDTTRTGTAVVS
jgi:hypothetical protein